MKFTIKLNSIKSIKKIEDYWTNQDYVNLLELFDYADAQSVPEIELFDMLSMAISDYEPQEAAEIVLRYKLGERLKEGQIMNLSQEMQEDKVSEEYSDISFHFPLFNINQLLRDCYNGKFPTVLASVIQLDLVCKEEIKITKEIVVRTLSDLLSEKSLLKRLFDEQLDSSSELKDAESIIWDLKHNGQNSYTIISSDYWLNREDFELDEFSGVLREDELGHL